jgi:hypothetical protein
MCRGRRWGSGEEASLKIATDFVPEIKYSVLNFSAYIATILMCYTTT